jgi:hypothetical protein
MLADEPVTTNGELGPPESAERPGPSTRQAQGPGSGRWAWLH